VDIEIIQKNESFLQLKGNWERLEKQSPDVTYYSTFEYNSIWWKVYKDQDNLSLFIIVVRQNDKIVGIAPLMIEKVKKKLFEYRVLKFLGRGDYLDFLIDFSLQKPQTVIKDIFKIIEENKNKWDELHLTHIKHNSLLTSYLLKSKYNKYYTYLIEAPFLDLNGFDDFEDYCKRIVSKNVKTYLNNLEKVIGFNFFCEHGNILEKMAELHIREKEYLKKKGRSTRYSLYEDKNRLSFQNNMYNNSDVKKTFCITKNNGDLIAYRSIYHYKNIYFSWNTAYDPDYTDFRLGRILFYLMIKQGFKDNTFKILDFGSGRYPWKFEWTNTFNLVYELKYSNPDNKKLKIYNKIKRIKKAIKP